ncbi:MAG: hypothetical protein M0Q91_11850 [Methanoregula sp.]|jgi:hypothetical protein|nr:hypothetical protein [Methanoregula sp.]
MERRNFFYNLSALLAVSATPGIAKIALGDSEGQHEIKPEPVKVPGSSDDITIPNEDVFRIKIEPITEIFENKTHSIITITGSGIMPNKEVVSFKAFIDRSPEEYHFVNQNKIKINEKYIFELIGIHSERVGKEYYIDGFNGFLIPTTKAPEVYFTCKKLIEF